ncbi:cyclic nucleotide-binding domain-containing protein [Novispirillum sp. DQ9]|uniref:cyclic nucleotide-binding domain-containing protein n=1 Tax=Novispirillum sp. DQ9 TaxID=3398612 RepID=UPI003C79AB45
MSQITQSRRTFQPGERLFREGDPAECAYVIVDGRVEISKAVRDDTHVLAVVGKGEIVGEMSLIDDQPRSATARAVGSVTCIVVSRAAFQAKLDRMDPVTRRLLTKFVGIARQYNAERASRATVIR